MITAVDTNVLINFWTPDPAVNGPSRTALERNSRAGALVICPAVYSELLAAPDKTRIWIDSFLDDVGIQIDLNFPEAVWVDAGEGFSTYAERRQQAKAAAPRRILVDFLVGAHALRQADRLLTADGWYSTIFPRLRLELV